MAVKNNIRFRTPYTEHLDPVFISTGESLTQQQYRSQCDINCILDSYGITDLRIGFDVNTIPYQEEIDATQLSADPIKIHQTILKANNEFEKLPNVIKSACNYNPSRLQTFLESEQGKMIIEQLKNPPIKEE